MIEGEEFLVLGEGWGFYPSTTEHLLRRLVSHNRFLWVDAIGCRAPQWNLYTLRRACGKALEWASPGVRSPASHEGVVPYSAPVLPLRPVAPVRWWNRTAMTRGITRRLRDLGMQRPILFATSPIAAEVIHDIPAKLIVYYILDNYEEMPHYYSGYVRDLEARLIDRADLVLATSQPLVNRKSRPGRPVLLLPQGVDFDHFHSPVTDGTPQPEGLAGISRPRILFMGLLAPWVDVDLLAKVARAYPNASLVLIGPVQTDIEALRKEPNVYFLGRRPYGAIPIYLAHCDVALIPFRQNGLTQCVNPLKLLEYLASGLPVISTPLPHLASFEGIVYSAKDSKGYIARVGQALAGFSGERRARGIAAARQNSWDSRAEQFSVYLQESLSARASQ